jgi:hypothetical protein
MHIMTTSKGIRLGTKREFRSKKLKVAYFEDILELYLERGGEAASLASELGLVSIGIVLVLSIC